MKPKTPPSRKRGISLPDMAPIAGVLLLFVSYFMLGRFQNPTDEIVASERLPASSTWHCKLTENHQIIVSLTAKNQLAFSVTSPEVQTAVIQAVALKHHVKLNAEELTGLATLPFLRIDVKCLPTYLALPLGRRNSLSSINNLTPLSEKQLVECIKTTLLFAETPAHGPIYIALRIDADVKMSDVNHLTALLREQAKNHFDLVTQFEQLKAQ